MEQLKTLSSLLLTSITTNTITGNGSRVDVFINNIFDKLCDSIRSNHPQLDMANATKANQINSLKGISKSNIV